jgi:Do/DeqQ family serine protease
MSDPSQTKAAIRMKPFVKLAPLAALALLLAVPVDAPLAQSGQASAREVPQSSMQMQLSFAPLVRGAAPAVVNVYGARERPQQQDHMEEFFRRFFGESGAMPRDRVERSLGSGVIVDGSGLVVTNHHVIEGMTEVKVALVDRREFDAEIVLRDPRTDLAVLRIRSSEEFPTIALGDSEVLEVGDLVLAIGNPFGVGQTVTQGIVSALARTQVGVTDYQFFIQTDAAINPGNSGGALLDMEGRVVGINTAIYSRSGGSHGIGFAIPSAMVRAVVDSARVGSSVVRRPWLGATVQAVTVDIAESVGLDRPSGVLVTNVLPDSPAEKAGMRRGDIIRTVAGQIVDDPDSFGYRFALLGVDGAAEMGILRGEDELSTRVALAPPPEIPPRELVAITSRTPLGGAVVANVSPAVADEMQLQGVYDGVVVTEVEERSIAARYGFEPGDVILEVNGTRVATSRDLDELMLAGRGYWAMRINRGGQLISTVLRG